TPQPPRRFSSTSFHRRPRRSSKPKGSSRTSEPARTLLNRRLSLQDGLATARHEVPICAETFRGCKVSVDDEERQGKYGSPPIGSEEGNLPRRHPGRRRSQR